MDEAESGWTFRFSQLALVLGLAWRDSDAMPPRAHSTLPRSIYEAALEGLPAKVSSEPRQADSVNLRTSMYEFAKSE